MAGHACIFQVSFVLWKEAGGPQLSVFPTTAFHFARIPFSLVPPFSLLPSEGDHRYLLEGAMRQKVTHGRAVFGMVLGT